MGHTLPSINRLLATLTLVCVLPVTALSIAELAWSYSARRAETLGHAVGIARALMSGIDERLHSVSVALASLSRSPNLAGGNLAAFHEEAAAVANALGVRNIALVDAEGRQLVNTRPAAAGQPPGALHPRVTELAAADTPRVLDLFRAPIEKRWVAGIGMATRVEGRTGYAITASLEPSLLEHALLRERLPATWIAAVLDGQGTIVARTHDHERFVGTRARAALIARISETAEDAVESVTVDDVPVVTAFSRSQANRWSVVIGIPRAELVAPVQRMLGVFGAGVAAALALTLWLSRRLAARISSSLQSLGAEARSVGHLSAIELPTPAFAEAHQLGQALLHADSAMRDAQESRQKAESLMEAALESSPGPVVCIDEADRVVAVNGAAVRRFRMDRGQLLGVPLRLLLPLGADTPGASVTAVQAGDRTVRALRLGAPTGVAANGAFNP